MATVIASKQSGTGTGGGVTVTKPTGLVEGDFLIAFIASATGGTSNPAHSGPSGWTSIQSRTPNNGTVYSAWAVKATSTQTAATDFSWTSGGDNAETAGAILRITGDNGFDSVATNIVSASATASGTSLSGTGVTTKAINSLILISGGAETISGLGIDFSDYAVVNNNPTWTIEYDIDTGGGGIRGHLGVAQATYTPKQATGNFSFSVSSTTDLSGAIVAITENINATGTHTHLAASPTLRKATASAGTTGTHAHLAVSPTLNKPTAEGTSPTSWTNENKNNSTWTNQNKS